MRIPIAVLLLTTLIVSTGLAQESGGGTSVEDVARELANPNTPLGQPQFQIAVPYLKRGSP